MEQILKEVIRSSKKGSISYAEYMETALYHPQKGYYMKEKPKLGKQGDFITSNHIHNVFGRLFANHFKKIIEQYQLPPVICEIGGGDGRFAHAFLDEWKKISGSQELTYYLVETSPYHQKLQREKLPVGENVLQFSSLDQMKEEISSFQGVIFSNELFDALPVRVVEKQEDKVFEVRIGIGDDGTLTEVLHDDHDELNQWLEKHDYELINGQRIEVPLSTEQILDAISKWISNGFVYSVDYGYTKDEWSHPARKDGSLRGYHQHKMYNQVLSQPGDMDITSHVHFDILKNVGEEVGLQFIGMQRQHDFLLRIGILDYLQENFDPNPFSEVSKQNRAIRSLIMDGGMSSAFHVVIQQKGFETLHSEDFLPKHPFSLK